VPPAVL